MALFDVKRRKQADEIEKRYDGNVLVYLVKKWGRDKDLDDAKAQLNKVIEEVGEIAHEISRNREGDDLKDAIGDALVTIIILSDICGYSPLECLSMAYDTIRDRVGTTSHGTFVKTEVGKPIKKLIRNRIKCKKCGDIIESKTVHDFVKCKCGSVFTDGGTEYLRRGGNLENIEELDEYEEASE